MKREDGYAIGVIEKSSADNIHAGGTDDQTRKTLPQRNNPPPHLGAREVGMDSYQDGGNVMTTMIGEEDHKVISSTTCDDVASLMEALTMAKESDPRGEDVAEITAVAIEHKYVVLEVHEYADKTRTFVLFGA